jgi:small subunit ribosomal protein S11
MGKKRIIEKSDKPAGEEGAKVAAQPKAPKARISVGTFYVQSTYNNTKMNVSDQNGNVLFWLSSGTLGFKGAKKGTPFAAAKAAEILADKAMELGIKEVNVVVNGVGSGRESSIRAFSSKGINILGIKDATAVPHNGPRPKKSRRV